MGQVSFTWNFVDFGYGIVILKPKVVGSDFQTIRWRMYGQKFGHFHQDLIELCLKKGLKTAAKVDVPVYGY